MANNIRIWSPVNLVSNDNDGFKTASENAKGLGSKQYIGMAISVYYNGGNARRVWVAYSNGKWINCVDAECEDSLMQEEFVGLVRRRAEQADINLGYEDYKVAVWTAQDNEDAMQRELIGIYN